MKFYIWHKDQANKEFEFSHPETFVSRYEIHTLSHNIHMYVHKYTK
jgi:hypothetical protein